MPEQTSIKKANSKWTPKTSKFPEIFHRNFSIERASIKTSKCAINYKKITSNNKITFWSQETQRQITQFEILEWKDVK